ncbi:MAG: hypothetical protein V1779_03360 [bacterium]
MKKMIILLSMIVAFIISVEQADAALYRKTANGGPNGYLYTREILWIYISCWDAGNSSCPKSVVGTNPTPPHQVLAVEYALNEIANGNLTGDEVQGDTNIEWTATSTAATTSEIKVWDTDEEEPVEPE